MGTGEVCGRSNDSTGTFRDNESPPADGKGTAAAFRGVMGLSLTGMIGTVHGRESRPIGSTSAKSTAPQMATSARPACNERAPVIMDVSPWHKR